MKRCFCTVAAGPLLAFVSTDTATAGGGLPGAGDQTETQVSSFGDQSVDEQKNDVDQSQNAYQHQTLVQKMRGADRPLSNPQAPAGLRAPVRASSLTGRCAMSGYAAKASRPRRTATPRELEVLALIAEGYSTSEIAKQLWITEETVRTHVRRVLDRLGARTRAHAVAIAFHEDLWKKQNGSGGGAV